MSSPYRTESSTGCGGHKRHWFTAGVGEPVATCRRCGAPNPRWKGDGNEAVYNVNLSVRMRGPDIDWDMAAEILARCVESIKWAAPGGFTVLGVDIDTAGNL